jgi:biopolymer transport protein ExbD
LRTQAVKSGLGLHRRATAGPKQACGGTHQRDRGGDHGDFHVCGDSRSTGGRTIAEMNITPLVDVMLVLLIIFMVAAPIATRSLDLTLPQQPPPQPIVEPTHLRLGVQGDGQFLLEGTVLSEPALSAALRSAARTTPNAIVDVTVSENADDQAFASALAAARRSGLTNIALQR